MNNLVGKSTLTIAIMQPYFVPYAGYFRLLAATDLFVLYDCVQFPRRGRVHRNTLPDVKGESSWLTLPLEKAPRDVLIRELRFRAGAAAELVAQFTRFPLLARSGPGPHGILDALRDLSGTPVDYLERLLERAAAVLGLRWNTLRSSSLAIPSELSGQERILAITKTLGAQTYVNTPGGRSLYDPVRFAQAGVELRFLSEYGGAFHSILTRLICESAEAVAAELAANTKLLK